MLGCESEEILSLKNSTNLNKVALVKEIINKDEQRVAYRLLNSTEKYTLWFNKLQNETQKDKNNKYHFTSKQIHLLNQLKNDLSIDFFKENSDSREYFKNIYVPNFIEKMAQFFTKEQIYLLFYTISDKDITVSNTRDGSHFGEECECHVGGAFSCVWGYWDDCNYYRCESSSSGCGFFGLYECNGMCD